MKPCAMGAQGFIAQKLMPHHGTPARSVRHPVPPPLRPVTGRQPCAIAQGVRWHNVCHGLRLDRASARLRNGLR